MKQERSSKVVGDTEEDKETSANVRNKAKYQQAFGLEQVNFCCTPVDRAIFGGEYPE